VRKAWTNPLYFYALPTQAQARRVAWQPLKALVPPDWLAKEPNESEMKIETKFGSTLYVVGMDKPQRVEGVQWDGGVVDESCDQKPGVFDRVLMPAFSHRRAWCWRIGVPKRVGPGAREFKRACDEWATNKDPDNASFSWMSEDILTEEQIRWARENLTDRDYNEQYRAQWIDASGLIFYAFDNQLNVDSNVAYDPSKRIVVGSDFNVDPMCWVVGHIVDNELHVFDEVFIRNTNTQSTMSYLYMKYGSHKAGWDFVGDATGRARKSAAASSDYIIIRSDRRFIDARVHYPKSNPARMDRFAACNALMCNSLGTRRFKVSPKCTHLIADLTARAFSEGTMEPDDYGDIGHITDALGYLIYWAFPLRVEFGEFVTKVHA